MASLPNFKSLKAEREFWEMHDVFEVLGEEGWEVAEAGNTQIKSMFVTKVGSKGAMLHVPPEWLSRIGAGKGQKLRVWTEGKRLVVELV